MGKSIYWRQVRRQKYAELRRKDAHLSRCRPLLKRRWQRHQKRRRRTGAVVVRRRFFTRALSGWRCCRCCCCCCWMRHEKLKAVRSGRSKGRTTAVALETDKKRAIIRRRSQNETSWLSTSSQVSSFISLLHFFSEKYKKMNFWCWCSWLRNTYSSCTGYTLIGSAYLFIYFKAQIVV